MNVSKNESRKIIKLWADVSLEMYMILSPKNSLTTRYQRTTVPMLNKPFPLLTIYFSIEDHFDEQVG